MNHLPSITSLRPLGAVAATVLAGALLVGCGDDNSAASVLAGDAATSVEPGEVDGDTEDGGSRTSGDLPSWSPEILTEGDDVVGLDDSDIDPLSDELLIHEVITGDGPPVEVGQTITADYFGQVPESDAPFDESFSSSPFQAPIGVGSLIQGWDEGLIGVPVGSRVVMSIPSDQAYGEAGSPPAIPGGATLFFVVDIIEAQ
ncbi:FKBP-type peptidyl-prolyl cis-trans isomerase [Nocardioides sp.]|uniref:FKBP-type peptidyl-prolyl cis-trans isomerase n=1 Tax=Nocardioides sp. TaxID=35761 RepID=UPI002B26E744|nr:FKBP-type peptidyl-prolyl cis-trans isomerase [Nocardioides sp.]